LREVEMTVLPGLCDEGQIPKPLGVGCSLRHVGQEHKMIPVA